MSFVFRLPRRPWRLGLGLTTSLIVALAVYGFQIEPNWLQINRVTIAIPGLSPEFVGYRLVQLGDLHMDSWMTAQRLQGIVNRVNAQQPDLVVLTGDYITMRPDTYGPQLTPVLQTLQGKDGAVGVLGNHDYYWHSDDTMAPFLEKAGVVMLQNQVHTIRRGIAQLNFAGVKDLWTNQAQIDACVTATIAALPAQGTNIFISHTPEIVEKIAPTGRFALQISGHSHGGQVRLPFLSPIVPPMVGQYIAGLYRVGHMWEYTSRGVGMVPPRVRFNCRPEIVVLELRGTNA
jgi:uncharacterized protein